MPSASTGPLLLAMAFAATGCAAGGGAVRFRGVVVGAPIAGAQYEDHPAMGEPVASAVVRVCHCRTPCVCSADGAVRTVRVDASGRYEIPEIVFGAETGEGMANIFIVQADAPGFELVHYTLDGDKPTDQERTAREHPRFLNFRMKRTAR